MNALMYRLDGMEPIPMNEGHGYHKSKAFGMVLGIAASVATMGAAAPMMAAGGLTSLAGGAMMAGGVMTGLGAVTGNAKLAKIGGILSLAGGLGAFATGANPLTGAGPLQQSESGFFSGVGDSIAEGTNAIGDKFSGFFSGGAGGDGGTISSISDSAKGANFVDASGNGVGLTPTDVGGAADESWFSKASKFTNDNKGLMEIGGKGLLGLATAGMEPDQQALLDAQAGNYDANAQLINSKNQELQDQRANANAQVMLIPENDTAAIEAAKAAGKPYSIIPVVGAGGISINQPKVTR